MRVNYLKMGRGRKGGERGGEGGLDVGQLSLRCPFFSLLHSTKIRRYKKGERKEKQGQSGFSPPAGWWGFSCFSRYKYSTNKETGI